MKKIWNFAKKACKKIRNQFFRARANYIKYYDKLPVDDKVILLESQHGANWNGNIFYIAKYLSNEPKFADYKIYFSARGRVRRATENFFQNNNINNVKVIMLASDEYFRILASAKYLFNDTSFTPTFIKKPGQVYLNTWHGTPLKTLGKQVHNDFHALGNIQKNFVTADYLLYPNEFTRQHIIEDYMLENISHAKTILSGYPRNEAFFNFERQNEIREGLNLEEKRVYAYMPTFRGTTNKPGYQKNDIYLNYYLYEIDKQLSEDEVLYVNLHPLTQKKIPMKQFKHIKAFPAELETYEFLSIVDCLVTDYSSVFFDFAVTGRKIVLFVYDLDEYLEDRGMYLDISALPFPRVFDVETLLEELRSEKQYDDEVFLKTYCQYERPDASRVLCDKVILGEDTGLAMGEISSNGKENVLIYAGNLALNGLTASLKNLLSQLDLSKRNYFLSFISKNVASNRNNLLTFPEGVSYFATDGDMDITIAERIFRKLFKMRIVKADFYVKVMRKRLLQEWHREFGNCQFQTVIQFNGYEDEVMLRWSQFEGNKAIFVHSDMLQEIKTRHNQRLDVLKCVYNAFDKVAVVTEGMWEPTKKIAKSDKNLAVVHNVIDAAGVREKSTLPFELGEKTTVYPDEEMLAEILAREGKIFVGNGRFSPEKGQLRLLKAFRRVLDKQPDVSLILVGGSSNGDYFQRIKDCITELELENNVVLLRALPNPFPLLKQCDYLVLSSFYEGFGLVLAEADILGKPVISTDISGPRGFMQKYGGRLVENSEEGLYQGMMELLAGKIPLMNVDYEVYNREAVAQFEAILSQKDSQKIASDAVSMLR